MSYRLSTLAQQLGLTLQGADREISGVNTLERAGPEELSFLANPKYAPLLATTRAGAVLVGPEHAQSVSCALISESPYLDFARAVQLFARPQGCLSGVSPLAFVHADARLAESCTVYPFAFIGPRTVVGEDTRIFPGCYVGEDCRIGRDCLLYPNVSVMAGTQLGDGVILHAGVVLGADGFGFAAAQHGMEKFPQIGRVVVEDGVEIGANTCVDRAALGETRIGRGTKIDNLVQIAHNVEVGEQCVLVAQVGIAGSTKVGRNVTMAGQVGVSGHLTIGDGAVLGPKTGVAKSIPAGAMMGGIPAMDRGLFLRNMALLPKLPEMAKRLSRLEKKFTELLEETPGPGGGNE